MNKPNRIPRRYTTRSKGVPGAKPGRPVPVMHKHCELCHGPYSQDNESRTTWIQSMNNAGLSGWECLCCGTWAACDKGDNGSSTKKAKKLGFETADEMYQEIQDRLSAALAMIAD